jgi:hypothetical protein
MTAGEAAANVPEREPGYFVGVEANRLVCLRTWGHWDLALMEHFTAEVTQALEPLRGAPFRVLSDSRGSPIQSREVALFRGRMMAMAASWGMRRVAFLASSTLSKLQLKHLARDSGAQEVEAFTNEAAARAWLAQPWSSAG